MDRPPIIVAPYDAELFGHWWFEGPIFLEEVLRLTCKSPTLELVTPSDYLKSILQTKWPLLPLRAGVQRLQRGLAGTLERLDLSHLHRSQHELNLLAKKNEPNLLNENSQPSSQRTPPCSKLRLGFYYEDRYRIPVCSEANERTPEKLPRPAWSLRWSPC